MTYVLALMSSILHFAYEIWWMNTLLLPSASNLYFIGHAAISASAALGMYPFFKSRFKIPWHSVCFALIFIPLVLLPIIGSTFYLIVSCALLFVTKERDIPYSSEDENKALFELFEFGTAETMEQEWTEELLEELDIEPYVDILKRGDAELKKGVIQKLSEVVSPISIKLLKISLNNENSEIRLMSSKALSGIEEDIHDDIITASQKVEREPSNMTAKNELGHIFYRYASLGLLDVTTQIFYFEKAIHEYLGSLQLNAKQEEILRLVGRILLQTQNYSKAEELFRRTLELKPDDEEARLDLCNALLGERNFEHLSQACVGLNDELSQYWGKTA